MIAILAGRSGSIGGNLAIDFARPPIKYEVSSNGVQGRDPRAYACGTYGTTPTFRIFPASEAFTPGLTPGVLSRGFDSLTD